MMVAPLTQVPALMDDVVALARGVHAQAAVGVARAREVHAEVADVETQALRMHAVANATAAVMPRVLLAFLVFFFPLRFLVFSRMPSAMHTGLSLWCFNACQFSTSRYMKRPSP